MRIFVAVGCIDIIPPEDAYLKRTEDTLVIGCYTSRSTWHLECRDGRWIGVVGNCSQRKYLCCVKPIYNFNKIYKRTQKNYVMKYKFTTCIKAETPYYMQQTCLTEFQMCLLWNPSQSLKSSTVAWQAKTVRSLSIQRSSTFYCFPTFRWPWKEESKMSIEILANRSALLNLAFCKVSWIRRLRLLALFH